MKNSRINWLLFLTILTMTVVPLVAASYFLSSTLETSLNLGFNRQIIRTLDEASQNLKRLKAADPENEAAYRRQFDEVENLRLVYSQPELVRGNIFDSLKIYFEVGLLAAVLLSVALATLLSRRIAKSYQMTFDELIGKKEKVRYLEEISSWQELAKMLAHEIKNPLTPIEVLVTSLTKSYLKKSPDDFKEQLIQTESMVTEELGHLKGIVDRFSEFSKIPKVQLVKQDVVAAIDQNIKFLTGTLNLAEIESTYPSDLNRAEANIDLMLLRQVFTNIVRNGVEANPGQKVRFKIELSHRDEFYLISVSNDGQLVPPTVSARIFEPYFSTKTAKDHMGLGLAIVKKVIIEHGGEISYMNNGGSPTFVISLRKLS